MKKKFNRKQKDKPYTLTSNKFAAIVTVRLNSKRLENKALMNINGLTAIEILIKRLKKLNNVSNIILATCNHKNLLKLKKICIKEKINFFVGHEKNVLKRIINCAEKFKVNKIVRITGDDIFRDIIKLDYAILGHENSNKDITIMKNIPYGLGSEIFNLGVLKFIEEKRNKLSDSSHLTWFIDKKIFQINTLDCKYLNCNKIPFTLDYQIDLNMMRFVNKNLGIFFTTDKLLNFCDRNKKKFKLFLKKRSELENKFENIKKLNKKHYELIENG